MVDRVYIQNQRRNTYRRIRVDPIAGALGAEISGVDLSRPIDDATFAEIRAAFAENLVIFFQDQSLTPETQCTFARRFGELTTNPYYKTMEDHPYVLRMVREPHENVQVIGRVWHGDGSFRAKPALGATLYCADAPPYGGDTLFSNLYLAYDLLDPGMQELADRLVVIHTDAAFTAAQSGVTLAAGVNTLNFDTAANETEHPLVRIHPETGRKALWMQSTAYCWRLKGCSRAQSLPLLEFFQQMATQEIVTCRYRWRKGVLGMWDNRCTQHFALDDYLGFRREMYRVEIAGDRPVGPTMPRAI